MCSSPACAIRRTWPRNAHCRRTSADEARAQAAALSAEAARLDAEAVAIDNALAAMVTK